MLVLGVVLKRLQIINTAFVDTGSKLVFNLTLPAMLFLSIINADLNISDHATILGFAVAANFACWLVLMFIARYSPYPFATTSVVVQGAFRANTGIIGIALMANAYGEAGIAASAFYVAAITLLYNVLAVISLTPRGSQQNTGTMIKTLGKNPLILTILAASCLTILDLPMPEVVLISGQYFADMTLPLALLCTGASLDFKQLRSTPTPALIATLSRLIIVPFIIVTSAIVLGFRDAALGLIFFMSASPTAAASYIMAKAMKADDRLAANIIAITTLFFAFTISAGLAWLRSWGFA
ncbi:AEC family transporter [Thaumasiovibrio subtropicus]|uniref:AEC family transporter n=1 Tax=Thaumasiovibrio subtropicus TaxID=1891207 RepID=UPI000B34CC40|nr:AEC family transporter [Thaumasiovibrio subtropicus]